MMDDINRINQVLPTITEGKTSRIQQWMRSVIHRLDHYKAEHHKLLKEVTTLLELALWMANLVHNEGGRLEREGVKTAKLDAANCHRRLQLCFSLLFGRPILMTTVSAREELRVTSGASIVIKNVLPFLQLLE